MKIPERLGLLLVAVWLIVQGLVDLIDLRFTGLDIVLALLALAAGILVLYGLRSNSLSSPRSLGLLLLGIWLILTGLLSFINLGMGGIDIVVAILAVAAGAFLLFAALSAGALGNLGMLLLAIWLLLTGLVSLLGLTFSGLGIILGLSALIGGTLLLVGR